MHKHVLAWLAVMLGLMGLIGQSQPVQAADDSLAKIQAKGTLVMGNSPNYPPYEFIVNEAGESKIVGMDVEIGEQIAKDLGVKLVIKKMSFESMLVALETGKVDMILSGFSPTPERKKHVDFTKSYYTAKQDIIINKADAGIYKDKANFTGKRVGAVIGTIPYDLAKKQIPDVKVVGMENAADLILALKSHKVDGVVKDSAVAIAYAASDPALAEIDGHFDVEESAAGNAIALQKGSDSLRLAINKSIDGITQKNLINKQYLKTAGKYMAMGTSKTTMWRYWRYFAKGVEVTLGVSLVAVILGVVLGGVLALLRMGNLRVLRWIATAFVEFVRGTPLMVQVMFIYFGLGMFWDIPAVVAGTIGVGLNSAAYVSEVFRSGIQAVAKGQTEAARSLGMSAKQTMKEVVFPQAIANIWPALGNEFISLIKETSIISIIGVTDLIYQLRIVQADTYKGVAPIAVAMVLYFIMTFTLSRVLKHYEAKMKH